MKKEETFIPQLDSCRFFAVMLVTICHWIPGSLLNKSPNGVLGVTFFFVLSGYLISGKLLATRTAIDSGNMSYGRALGVFFYKRSLRIFPLYFMVIAVLFLLNSDVFGGHFVWYATYTSNFLIFKIKAWVNLLSHFWTLAVEEQFYLLWPLIIFFINGRILKFIFPVIILVSLTFKFFAKDTIPFYEVLTISCFDAFGVGSLLAYAVANPRYTGLLNNYRANSWLLAGASLFAFGVFMLGYGWFFGLAVSIVSAIIIMQCRLQVKGIAGWVLDNSMLRYFGKISYGLYVYHNIIPWLFRCLAGKERRYPVSSLVLPFKLPTSPFIVLLMEAIFLVLIASLSWYVFEKPLNNLKRLYK